MVTFSPGIQVDILTERESMKVEDDCPSDQVGFLFGNLQEA